MLDPWDRITQREAFVPRGASSGERGSIRQVAPGQGQTLQFSRQETLVKAGK